MHTPGRHGKGYRDFWGQRFTHSATLGAKPALWPKTVGLAPRVAEYVLVGSSGTRRSEKYWDERVTGRGTVNFRSIGTAGLILGAKRGSAVPILLKLTSRREITRSGYSNPYFGSISAILRVVASDCGWSLPSNSTCPASARRYKSSASSPFPCYWNTTAIRYTVESICE